MKIKVNTEKGIKTIVGNKEILENIKTELAGMKRNIQEYKTINGEIITDLDILNLVETK